MEMLSGGIALVFIAIAFGEWSGFDPALVSQRSALALVYLTVIGSCAFVAYAWLLRVAPTPLVATYAYVNPLVAVLLGYFLADEPMSARTLLAAGLVVGSVVLVSGERPRPAAPGDAPVKSLAVASTDSAISNSDSFSEWRDESCSSLRRRLTTIVRSLYGPKREV
jgi:uncharacterized membrane protein